MRFVLLLSRPHDAVSVDLQGNVGVDAPDVNHAWSQAVIRRFVLASGAGYYER